MNDAQGWAGDGDRSPVASAVRWGGTPWILYGLTVLSAVPLVAILAGSSPQPPGSCSGIGFGCSIHGRDLAEFVLVVVGLPYAVALLVLIAVSGLLPGRWRAVQVVVALVGLALPWAVVVGSALAGSG